MDRVSKLVENPTVTPELQEKFDQIKNALQAPFIPNFFQVWGGAPTPLEGIWPAMKHILASGSLDRKLKEMMFLAISSMKSCYYCEAAHSAFAGMLGVSPEQVNALINTHTIEAENTKEKAAIDYAVKLAKDSHSGTPEDVENLKSLGFEMNEIMEIIAMSGLAVFYNHLANATQITIDPVYLKNLPESEKYTAYNQ